MCQEPNRIYSVAKQYWWQERAGILIDGQEYKKGDESTLKDTKHELIVAIANYGYNTQVMRAAEEGGATGGTVLHGKGVGMKRAEQFLGVSLVSEKEVILLLQSHHRKMLLCVL